MYPNAKKHLVVYSSLLFSCLLMLSLNISISDDCGRNLPIDYPSNIYIEMNSTDYVFPDPGLLQISESERLAENLSLIVGLTGRPTPIWNDTPIGFDYTIQRANKLTVSYSDVGILLARQKAYNFSNGLITLYYDNLNGTNDSLFTSFRIILFDSQVKAFNSSEREAVSLPIIDSMGIPRKLLNVSSESGELPNSSAVALPYGDYQSYGKFIPSNLANAVCTRIDLILSARFGNLDVVGANILDFTFNNDTGQLIRVQGSFFINLPSNLSFTAEQALEIGRNSLSDLTILSDRFGPFEWQIDSYTITGLRMVPTTDDLTGNRALIPCYEYYAYLSTNDPQSSKEPVAGVYVLLAIDSDSGDIIDSWLSNIPYEPPGPKFLIDGWTAAAILLPISFAVVGIVIIGPPELAYGVIGALVIPLYMRIKGSYALDNFNRGRIYDRISTKPGCSFADLKKDLAILNGSLAYHLMVLEKLDMIKTVKDGNTKRFFAYNAPAKVGILQRLNKMQNLILAEIIKRNSTSTIELARSLNISRQRVHYNLRRLQKLDIVSDTSSGWKANADLLKEPVAMDAEVCSES